MADIMGILSASYAAAATTTFSKSAYKNVDLASYHGTWTGTYTNHTKFKISVSDVSGFRAKVKYDDGSIVRSQNVLIKDNSFKVGDTKFTLWKSGTAVIKTIVTDPATGGLKVMTGI